MKIGSVVEANAAKRDIERLVRAWCDSEGIAPDGNTIEIGQGNPCEEGCKAGDVQEAGRTTAGTPPPGHVR